MSDVETNSSATRRARALEALAFGLVALLPVVPHLVFHLRTGVPRFGLFGDFALLEQAVRHVWSGDTLLGPYSRFRWNHPGPLFFYVAAPFQAAFGAASTGLYVATCFVNAAAAATIGACARMFMGRAHGVAAVLVVLSWFAAFGNISANPWNPLVIALPLVAFFVAAASLARGKAAAAYPLVAFGALVSQTHIAAVSTVGIAGVIALATFFVREARRGTGVTPRSLASITRVVRSLDRADKRRFAGAAILAVVLFLPPLIEQCTAPTGNITKVASFFADRSAPMKPLSLAIQHWTTATSWMPDRLVSRALPEEGAIPLVMHWDPVPDTISKTARTIALLHVVVMLGCGFVAARRRDTASLSLLCFGTIGGFVAMNALQAIVGPSYHYLVFWTTAASTVAWMGAASTIAVAVEAIVEAGRLRGLLFAPLGIAMFTAAAMTTSLQHEWLTKCPYPPASRPFERDALRAVHDALRERLARDGAVAVIHPDGAWDMAHAMVLELEKDGVDVRVPERDRWNYFGVRSSEGVDRPLHVYFSTTPLPLECVEGLEPIAKSGDIAMYGSSTATPGCERP